MKKILIPLIVVLISGCGLFRKIDHTKTESQQTHSRSSELLSNEVDTSKRTSTEHWKLTIPGIDKSPLTPWQPGPTPDLSGATNEMKESYLELLAQYKKLSDQQFGKGWNAATLEFFKSVSENLGKSKNERQKDSASFSSKDTSDHKVKEPIIPDWVWSVCVLIGFTGLVYFILRKTK
ncbi:hypothetical protein [Pedobacter ginsengisoli]|uniref:hypothetical protein n=1 Tax=Pedobacter ginsengisoli TaxID=363852 RepID=UPI00254E2DFE|nr:hypothetical protein [Pedobacter ginsengisoli]